MNKYIILGLIVILGVSSNTKAETLSSALSKAYINIFLGAHPLNIMRPQLIITK